MNEGDNGGINMADFKQAGFDDIIVLAPVPAVISEAAEFWRPGCDEYLRGSSTRHHGFIKCE